MVDASAPAGDKLQLGLTAGVLALAVLLGGGQGGMGDTLTQLLALALLAYLVVGQDSNRRRLSSLPLRIWLPLGLLLVPLLQMMPMPLSAWTSVAGRAPLVSQLASVGLVPEPHIALQVLAPERAVWSLFPALAIYLSALTLTGRQQRLLFALVLGLALLGLLLGLMQVAAGPESALYFYSNTNRGAAVGFFANRNHLAGLLLMALPLSLGAIAIVIGERGNGKPVRLFVVAAAIGFAIMLILGLALTRSRAGLLLGMLGLLLSVPMVFSVRGQRGLKRVFTLTVAAALALTVQFALLGILQRLQVDPLSDYRWQIAEISTDAARSNGPTGSGLGTFRQVFQALDTKQPGQAIVNHAHNDYLELWLEAGWLFIAVAISFVGLILWWGVAAWRSSDARHSLLARAASIALLLMLLHSALDYPLRTTANQAVFALLLASLLSWTWARRASNGPRRGSARGSGRKIAIEEETH